MERKLFQSLPGAENPQFMEDGKRIYLELRKKYPDCTNEHYDNLLNGLCAALVCLISLNVDKDNHRYLIQVINKILSNNLS
jgi:hypothetical protein